MGKQVRAFITQSKPLTFAVLMLGISIQHKLLWEWPILEIIDFNLPGNLPVYLARSISVACSVILIWIFAPQALVRIKVKISKAGIKSVSLALAAYFAVGLVLLREPGLPLWLIIDGGIFALFIGLDEEFFGRGFIFGTLEKFGVEIAMAGSAIFFGLQHFANYLSGNDSFNYVLGHMVSAAGFGYLMAAVMVMTGSVWLPVFMHGFADYRWVLMAPDDALAVTSGNTDWLMILLTTGLMVLIARVILWDRTYTIFSGKRFDESTKTYSLLRYLGLVE
ncbi:MAG: CPBP family intramembrane metalloprotease [Candidatus Nanopelagicaceae bacterium]|nr:CPBP family intramembrane metalloprotease [Candidatus Nanopelagicaceae bacterium]